MALEAGEIDELRGVLWLSKVYEPAASLVAGAAEQASTDSVSPSVAESDSARSRQPPVAVFPIDVS